MSGAFGKKYREITDSKTWKNVYSEIYHTSGAEASKFTTNAAKANAPLNRYPNVLPYDQTIVALQSGVYINASHLILKDVGRHYILTQGPVKQSIPHFWQMIFEYKVKCIIMLNRLYENMSEKCSAYFPGKENGQNTISTPSPLIAGNLEVELKKEEHKSFYTFRTLNLKNKNDNKELSVLHYQFNKWPDHGVPDTTEQFLEFLFELRHTNHLNANKNGPVCCHCSAGIGRTGTFVVADVALVIAEKTKDPSKIDIKHMIIEHRRSRMKLIQHPDQLQFAWKVVVDALDNERWKPLLENPCFDETQTDTSIKEVA